MIIDTERTFKMLAENRDHAKWIIKQLQKNHNDIFGHMASTGGIVYYTIRKDKPKDI